MSVVVITPPSQLLDLTMVKRHLRVDQTTTDEDTLIQAYMDAAQSMIDGPSGWLGRCVGVQTLELHLSGFVTPIWGWANDGGGLFWGASPDNYSTFNAGQAAQRIALPFPPLVSVTSVSYEDSAGAVVAMPSSAYLATEAGMDTTFGTTFPSGRWEANAVKIRYTAGYATLPGAIRAALLLMVGDLYANRETVDTGLRAASVVIPMSTTVQALLSPFRVYD